MQAEYVVDIDRKPSDFPILECREQEMRKETVYISHGDS